MTKKRKFLALGLIWVMLLSAFIHGPSLSGAYASEVWIEISNATDLNNIRNDLSANYVLTADIDLNGSSWVPIGSSGTPFTGKLNGNAKVIRNFVINDTNGDEKGLFGAIGASGEVKNLGIEGANIIAGDKAGVLAGVNNGTIERSFTKGSITGKVYAGGLVGSNETTGQVVYSFSSGSVRGKSSIGGLIGDNKGAVNGSYSSSEVANSVFNNYLLFDGSDDYISIPHAIYYETEKFTLEAWFQWDELVRNNVDFIVGKGFEQFEIHTGGGSGIDGIRFIPIPHVGSDSWIDAYNVIKPGWFHVAAVYDYVYGSSYADAKVYINGVPQELKQSGLDVGTTARMFRASNPLSGNTADFNIGRRSGGGSNFKGKISDVRFWNVARTAEEIVADKDRQLSGSEPGLIGYWKLDETAGEPQDSTVYNNDGTLIGGITRVQEVPTNFGGLVGNNTGTVTNSYYDTDISGQTDNTGKGEPATSSNMTTETTFVGWDFASVWGIDVGVNDGYPHLRAVAPYLIAPVLNSALPGNGQVHLEWDSVTGATGYTVYASTTSGLYTLPVTTVSGTVYDVTGLTNGTTYYFAVRATNSEWDSALSNEISVVPGLLAGKVLTADTTDNNVDNDIEITFGADPAFEGAITGVSFNGNTLAGGQYTVSSGKVTLHPSVAGNSYLRTPGTGNVVITATGYNDSTVSQTITHGALTGMVLTQNITAPATNRGDFAQQPIVTLKDIYGNTVSSDNTTQVTVYKKDAGNWTLKGTTTLTAVYGVVAFTGLGADNNARISEAQLAFKSGALPEVTSATVTLPGPSSGGSSSTDSGGTSTPVTNVVVLVNGQVQNAGTATTITQGGSTLTTVVVDEKKLEEKLATEGNGAVVTIPVNTKADVVIGELNGQMVKKMESKQAVVEVKTETATYTLPAQQINIDAVSAQLGTNVELKDVKVQIEIAKPTPDEVKVLEDSAKKGEFSIVVHPVEFSVKCTYGNKTVNVSSFNSYVERRIAIPEGVDPKKITTGIVVGPDGTVRHVPTQIINIDGKYFAQINSLTNSTYSVVWNPVEFKDVKGHWAQEAINDMGARMVVNGVGKNVFQAEGYITRAEFAAVVVRGLGLKPGTGKTSFSDVKNSDWYSGYIETAQEYGILTGNGNGTFRPLDKITREQAMAMIARAMKITGLKVNLEAGEEGKVLAGFGDSGQVSKWAKNSITALVKGGLVVGDSGNILAPKAEITRAEVVVMVRKLLKNSKLI